MANDKRAPSGAVHAAHTPDALDLLKIERRIDLLETEKAKLEAKSKLTPGRTAQLAKINEELGRLAWARISATEHVRANLHQSEIYEREKEVDRRDAARQRMLDEKKEVAAQGGTNYREALRTYIASWKKKSKISAETASRDQGCEPE